MLTFSKASVNWVQFQNLHDQNIINTMHITKYVYDIENALNTSRSKLKVERLI